MLEYKVITLNDENAIALENLRFKVYDYKNIEPTETYFYREIKNGKILPFGVYENNELIAGCYVSNSYKTLFIEHLFVLKEYQNSENHIGTNLLRYVLDNKEICENFFKMKFEFSYLDNRCSKSFCEALGYKENRNDMMLRSI